MEGKGEGKGKGRNCVRERERKKKQPQRKRKRSHARRTHEVALVRVRQDPSGAPPQHHRHAHQPLRHPELLGEGRRDREHQRRGGVVGQQLTEERRDEVGAGEGGGLAADDAGEGGEELGDRSGDLFFVCDGRGTKGGGVESGRCFESEKKVCLSAAKEGATFERAKERPGARRHARTLVFSIAVEIPNANAIVMYTSQSNDPRACSADRHPAPSMSAAVSDATTHRLARSFHLSAPARICEPIIRAVSSSASHMRFFLGGDDLGTSVASTNARPERG